MDSFPALTRRTGLALLLSSAAFPALSAAGKREEVAYGKDGDQKLDVYTQMGLSSAPVLVFVHGGAWVRGDKRGVNQLPSYAERNGFLLISVGYRLAPEVDARGSAQDVAAALAWVKDNAARYGGDPARIYLAGHSAGAHLAALIGVDAAYLTAAKMTAKDLAGIILLDGAGYQAAQEMKWFDARGGSIAQMFHAAFDKDPAGLSPALLPKRGQDIPPFLIFYIESRANFPPQARELAAGLRNAGARFAIRVDRHDTHGEINEDFGRKGDAQGEAAAAFIKTGVLPANDLPPLAEDLARRGGGGGGGGRRAR